MAIIFDFDGTIADSFDYVTEFLLAEAGVGPVNDETKQLLRGRSMLAIARQLGFKWWQLPRLFYRGRRGMSGTIKHVKPFDGMPEVIRKLHNEGHELFIVSNNTVRNIRGFLHKHELHTYFLEIYGGVSIFGKAPALRRLMKENNFEVKDCIYIGDELRDAEAAQSLKMKIISVEWGFANAETLKKINPQRQAVKPEDIITILER